MNNEFKTTKAHGGDPPDAKTSNARTVLGVENRNSKLIRSPEFLSFQVDDDGLDVLASSSTGPRAMGNGTRRGSKVARVGIDVDQVTKSASKAHR